MMTPADFLIKGLDLPPDEGRWAGGHRFLHSGE